MIETTLLEQGWKKAGSCHCNMTLNLKYSKGYWLIYHMPKRRQFIVKFDGKRVTPVKPDILLLNYVIENTKDPFSQAVI